MLSWWQISTSRGRAVTALATVLLGAGLWAGYPVVAGLGGVLLLLVVVEVISVLGGTGTTVERTVHPEVVLRHAPCSGTLRVQGRRRRGLVRLDLSDLVDGSPIPVRLPEREPAESATETVLSYEVPTPRRGLIEVGPARLRLYGLTGMAARTTQTGEVDHVRVLPRRIALTSLMHGTRRAHSGGDASQELGGTDLVGLHEYAMGDDLRRLHWATSARTGTLMVREDAEPSEPQVCVVIDDLDDSYTDSGDRREQFEEVVEMAAALCRRAVELGSPVRLATTSGRHQVQVPGSASRGALPEVRDLDWTLAEIMTVGAGSARPTHLSTRDLDVAVVVTGAAAELRDVAALLGHAPTRVVAVIDPAPGVSTRAGVDLIVLRAASSESLASAWDRVGEGVGGR